MTGRCVTMFCRFRRLMIQKPLFTRRHLKPLNGNPERGRCRINLRALADAVCGFEWIIPARAKEEVPADHRVK
jgi:hypothetical protein